VHFSKNNITWRCKGAWTYTLIPAGSLLVSGGCSALVTELDLEQFSEVLLVSGSAAEVAFATVMCNG